MRAIGSKWKTLMLAAAVTLLTGCGRVVGGHPAGDAGNGAGPAEPAASEPARPPSILRPDASGEIRLVARPARLEITRGGEKEVWTYNGSVPDPEIRIERGETVRVRFKKELPVPTTIHWHGYPVPNAMDGVPA